LIKFEIYTNIFCFPLHPTRYQSVVGSNSIKGFRCCTLIA